MRGVLLCVDKTSMQKMDVFTTLRLNSCLLSLAWGSSARTLRGERLEYLIEY